MKEKKFETKAIHAGNPAPGQGAPHGATNMPVYLSSAFAYENPEDLSQVFQGKKYGYIYSRISNPTVAALEQRIAALENGRAAAAVATGMAAIQTALLALAGAGDHIVASKSLFGGTSHLFEDLFARLNISVTTVDPSDLKGFKKAIKKNTQAVFIETIGNPKLDVCNVQAIANLAHDADLPLVVDATLTPPCVFQGKAHGADVVVHSSTKYMSGSGNVVGGVLIDTGNFKWKTSRSKNIQARAKKYSDFAFISAVRADITNSGNILSPFHAALFMAGLETLSLRVNQHGKNAKDVALFFDAQGIDVNYPGLSNHKHADLVSSQFNGHGGGMVTIRLGSKKRCFDFISKLKLAKNLANLGDMKTLIIHPASTIYLEFDESCREAAGVYDDLIRISVGCEHIDDIIEDFKQALA